MNGIPVARLFGFEIRIHPSWVLIVAFITVVVVGQLDEQAPDLPVVGRWLMGAVIAAAFLLSVLAHELGHGVAARRRGLDVGPITVYFFGGSASFHLESERPRDEVVIALAGPLVSLAIGGVLAIVGFAASFTSVNLVQAIGGVAVVLAALNLLLGGANLVPAYPLDGGRLVRAIVWARSGDERKGSRFAAMTGRVSSWVLLGAGFAIILARDTWDGLMLGLSGWFLGSASRAIIRRLDVQDLLAGLSVGDVMERGVSSIPPNLTVDTFAQRVLDGSDAPALPVVSDEQIVGIVGIAQLRRLRRGSWATTRAEDLMVAPPLLPIVAAGDTLWSALDRLRRSGLDGLPVAEGAGLLGVVTRQAILATVQSRARLRGVSLR
ncbi:MAG: site-2 protease family protein [Chloroflexota bacterium]|nr:site-2 protease family protein [Chloroflexota bacterium]